MMEWINYAWPVLQIIGINIVLSGDNAVVIALASRRHHAFNGPAARA